MKSTTILNYLAFTILYIALFAFLYNKNTEIVAFWLLLIVNTSFVLYNTNVFSGMGTLDSIQKMSWLSILISGSLTSIALVFVAMMIGNMKIKYENTFGTPINLPPEYKEKLELFKKLVISIFCLCFITLALLFYVKGDLSNLIPTNVVVYLNVFLTGLGYILKNIAPYVPYVISIVIVSLSIYSIDAIYKQGIPNTSREIAKVTVLFILMFYYFFIMLLALFGKMSIEGFYNYSLLSLIYNAFVFIGGYQAQSILLVLLSLSSIAISSRQVWIANSFSILTRQELMR
jgi:hypothetical protein